MPKYLLQMKDNFKILLEDDQKIYNKWVKGIAKQEGPSHVITVDDVINRYRNTCDYEMIKQLPFGLEFLLNQIGDTFSKIAMIRADLASAMKNPIIFEHSHRINAVNVINEKMEKIQQILFSTTEDMNKILEKTKKQDNI